MSSETTDPKNMSSPFTRILPFTFAPYQFSWAQFSWAKLSWSLVLAGISLGSVATAETAPATAQITRPNNTAQNSTGPSQNQEAALQTGDVQVTLRWESTDDLDLSVKDPSGEVVSFFNPEIASGGQFDVDANSGCQVQSGTPLESIFWPAGTGILGNYMVVVTLFNDCGSGVPASFTLEVSTYDDTQTYTGTVSADHDSARFPFSLSAEPTD